MSICTNEYKRTVIRGDSDRFRVTFTKRTEVNGVENFEPIDITGWDVRFTVRKDVPATEINDETDALIHKNAILTDPKNGIAIIYVPAEETTKLDPGIYYYDIQYIKPLDDFGYNQVHSIRRAKYEIIGDITRDIDYTISGGSASDFAVTDESDYVVINNVETDEEGNKTIVPVTILNPCKDFNGGEAEELPLERMLDGGNAKLDKPELKVLKHENSFFDKEDNDLADDGYEI